MTDTEASSVHKKKSPKLCLSLALKNHPFI